MDGEHEFEVPPRETKVEVNDLLDGLLLVDLHVVRVLRNVRNHTRDVEVVKDDAAGVVRTLANLLQLLLINEVAERHIRKQHLVHGLVALRLAESTVARVRGPRSLLCFAHLVDEQVLLLGIVVELLLIVLLSALASGLRVDEVAQLADQLVLVVPRVPEVEHAVALLLLSVEEWQPRVRQVTLETALADCFVCARLVEVRCDE